MVLERKKRRLDQLHALKSMVRVSFLASTTIGHVETLRRSQTRARKSELELNLEATRGLLFIFLFSIRLAWNAPQIFSHQLLIDW
jgi:hypothetical protein